MSRLELVLDLYDKVTQEYKATFPPDVVMEAARKVANPDYEAAWAHYYGGDLGPEGRAYEHFCDSVNIALGIDSEDT